MSRTQYLRYLVTFWCLFFMRAFMLNFRIFKLIYGVFVYSSSYYGLQMVNIIDIHTYILLRQPKHIVAVATFDACKNSLGLGISWETGTSRVLDQIIRCCKNPSCMNECPKLCLLGFESSSWEKSQEHWLQTCLQISCSRAWWAVLLLLLLLRTTV